MTQEPLVSDAVMPAAGVGIVRTALRTRPWHWAVLAGILVLATGLRVHHLTAEGLWMDELYMLQHSAGHCYADHSLPRDRVFPDLPRMTGLGGAGPVTRIWTSLTNDAHPPLYYVLLRLWRDAFGSSDAALRSLSVVVSLAGVVLLFEVGRLLVGPASALWACLLMALAQPQIWYAQEARSYALLIAMLLGAATALVRIERMGFGRLRAVALGGCLLGAMLTHYFAVAVCAALGVYAVLRLRGPVRTRVVGVMAASAVVYAMVWGPFLLSQLGGDGLRNTWIRDGAPGFLSRWAGRMLLAPFRLFTHPRGSDRIAAGVFGVLLALSLAAVRRRQWLLLPGLCALFAIALPAVLDLFRGTLEMEFVRYFLAGGPFEYLLVAGLLADPQRRRRPGLVAHVLPAAMVVCCMLSLPWVYAPHKLSWRPFGRSVAAAVRPGDAIVFYNPGIGDWYAGVELVAIEHYAPATRARAVLLDGPASPATLSALADAPTVWLASDSTGYQLTGVLPGYTPGRSEYTVGVGYLVELRRAAAPAPAPVGGQG
jgi:uncharacterized membrane protein